GPSYPARLPRAGPRGRPGRGRAPRRRCGRPRSAWAGPAAAALVRVPRPPHPRPCACRAGPRSRKKLTRRRKDQSGNERAGFPLPGPPRAGPGSGVLGRLVGCVVGLVRVLGGLVRGGFLGYLVGDVRVL